MLLVVASYFLSVMAAGSLFVLPLVVAVRDSDEDGWVSGFLDRQAFFGFLQIFILCMYVSYHTNFLFDSFLAFAGDVMLMIIIDVKGSWYGRRF